MGTDVEILHGFPHLTTVHRAVTALYRRLSAAGVRDFVLSVPPADVAFSDDEDPYLGVQRVAGAIVRHLRLPDARMIVTFHGMRHAGSVELAAGPEYFVELNTRFKEHRRDIGAALAHEVTHVFLHRLGLAFTGTRDNEILTDTVSAYLGAGWLLLDAYREDALTTQKLGYLTPEEFGYVLALRARAFGEDPAPWFTSPRAYDAYAAGARRARNEERRAPLAGAGRLGRHRYARDRRAGVSSAPAAYVFEGDPQRVRFPCPTCRQWLRVGCVGRVRVRCGVCGGVAECDT
ncbi:hypothetical protein I5Q34_18900 [Streptomyces sp. AV19]|uniref:hypothetical protein n=1 Tax=Streptomyces sp. AV19 TaxID=2793068 RepID=UPI0018FEB69E|nr:hypothetical protein [Streptomyces sp. AV19]MBH1936319.1 hypothetical protein [Streptomyces sp. AV19]MDG4532356.1 hypothetical protein [Streptomyces sp. AV19]